MSYGRIIKIEEDPISKTMSGELKDIETGKKYNFSKEAGIPDVNRQDIVNFTDNGGTATGLTPNLSVRLANMATASQEVQDLSTSLLLAMAKDKNMTDVISKKI